jgi:hypothetical protein
MHPELWKEHLFMNQARSVQTRTCGPAIKILNIPIIEPSEPFGINSDNIAKGSASILAQPIPEIAISISTTFVLVKNPIPKKARAVIINAVAWIFLFPKREDKIPIGIETIKHTKLNIAKHIDAKFVAWGTKAS